MQDAFELNTRPQNKTNYIIHGRQIIHSCYKYSLIITKRVKKTRSLDEKYWSAE